MDKNLASTDTTNKATGLAQAMQINLDHLFPYTERQNTTEKALTDLTRKIAAACLLSLYSNDLATHDKQRIVEKMNFIELMNNILTKANIEEEHKKEIANVLKELSPEDAHTPKSIVAKFHLMDDTSPMNQLHRNLYLLLQQNEDTAQAYTYMTL